jgi:hypothetical protein
MDQRSDNLRQGIESTRAALDEKLDTLESKARETFDLRHQVAERPWMALGAAMAAGFVLGNMGGGEEPQRWHGQPAVATDYNQHAYMQPETKGATKSDSFLEQFDDEIALLKGAAITALTTFLHDSIRTYIPTIGQHLDDSAQGRTPASMSNRGDKAGRTPSTAPNASFEQGAGRTGFDSPPGVSGQSSQLANPEVGGIDSYYPPGSPGVERRDTARSQQPAERTVGEKSSY